MSYFCHYRFGLVEPAERSDRPDMPSYLHARKRCPGLDPTRITTAHRTYAATRDFAAYRLNLHSPGKRGEEILIFRADHYVSVENDHTAATPSSAEATLLPGTFLSMIIRGYGFPVTSSTGNVASCVSSACH